MKISRRFCASFLSAAVPAADALAALLTARGLEVESVTAAAVAAGIRVGRITECAAHPQADKLRVCAVDVGDGVLSVVCGAANAREGLLVAVAPAGTATVGGAVMAARSIRGVESAGMICSAAELGVGEDAAGVMELSDVDGAVGDLLDDALLLNDDVLEVNVTPNRGDCFSHLGIAREIAAAIGCEVVLPAGDDAVGEMEEVFPAVIDDAALAACPYFGCLIVRGADCARPLPWRWRTLLERCGARPVSAVVDITNYLMLALGQPMHAFDLDKLQRGIRVRFAAAGESLRVLDGSEVQCAADTLLVCDEDGALALAGVMGGAASGITAATTNILLEAAHFTPDAVAGRAREFKLNSEAAFRFERGVDATLPPRALAAAAAHIRQACGGKAGRVAHCGAAPAAPAAITLAAARIGQILGIEVAAADAKRLLDGIGLATAVGDDGALQTQVPPWRFDMRLPEDVIEEIVRLHGYDNLPETLPAGMRAVHNQLAAPGGGDAARTFFAARGFYEIISYAFVSPVWEQALSTVPAQVLANPMSEEMAVMRTTLWGGLIDRALFNLRRRQERIFLFEVGSCFLPPAADDELPRQPRMVGGLMQGLCKPVQWAADNRGVDFYDLKGVVEEFLAPRSATFAPPRDGHPALHPGKAAEIFLGDAAVGVLGELHPDNPLRKPFKKTPPLLFALDLDALAAQDAAAGRMLVAPPSRLPPLWRDLACIVDAALPAGELLAAARDCAPRPPVVEVQLFDFFAGDGERVAAGKKSCGLRFLLQGQDDNLTGEEIDEVMQTIIAGLRARCQIALRD